MAAIDYLSRLPPELLSTIFDQAHDHYRPPTRFISKALLPHTRRTLYRRVPLVSSSALALILETLRNKPTLGSLVVELDISERDTIYTPETLEELLQHLPSLRHLSGDGCFLDAPTATPLSTLLPSLTSLSYTCSTLRDSDLETLSQFSNLTSLEVQLIYYEGGGGRFSTKIPNIRSLSVSSIVGPLEPEGAVWCFETAQFVDCFTNLTHLTLRDEMFPRYANLLQHLTKATSTLTSLTLRSSRHFFHGHVATDHVLPRFENLEYVDLREGASPSLHVHLQKLPRLHTLGLGSRSHHHGPSLQDLLSFVQGPHRLPSLKRLKLDTIFGGIGRRADVNDALDDYKLPSEEGWECPQFAPDSGEEDVIRLLEVGAENGVAMKGSTFKVIGAWDAYHLEEANRVILRTHQTKSFHDYEYFILDGGNCRLPAIDSDHLDPKKLKLVKIDLPEEGWFQFTLE